MIPDISIIFCDDLTLSDDSNDVSARAYVGICSRMWVLWRTRAQWSYRSATRTWRHTLQLCGRALNMCLMCDGFIIFIFRESSMCVGMVCRIQRIRSPLLLYFDSLLVPRCYMDLYMRWPIFGYLNLSLFTTHFGTVWFALHMTCGITSRLYQIVRFHNVTTLIFRPFSYVNFTNISLLFILTHISWSFKNNLPVH